METPLIDVCWNSRRLQSLNLF